MAANYVEERTDNYVVIQNDNYGLKFRNGKNLELKCRVEASHNIEGWYKRKFGGIKLGDDEMKISVLQQRGEKYVKDPDLGPCLEMMGNADSFIVQCKKERVTGGVDGMSVEQTECEIAVVDAQLTDNQNQGKINKFATKWISVCIEDSPQHVDIAKMMKVTQSIQDILCKLDENYIIASYPGWLVKLLYG